MQDIHVGPEQLGNRWNLQLRFKLWCFVLQPFIKALPVLHHVCPYLLKGTDMKLII